MRRIRSAVPIVVLALAATRSLTGAAAAPAPETPAASRVLRLATWHCYMDPQRPDKPLAWREFERESGAVVQAVPFGTGGDIAAAAAAGEFDLVIAACDIVPGMIEAGSLVPVPVARLRHYDGLQPNLRHARYGLVGGADFCVPYCWGALALAYDTAVFSTPPRSWQVLWDPAWAGRTAHWDDAAVLWTAALASGQRNCFGLQGQPLWEAGRWAARLCAQVGLLWRDENVQIAAMASGKVVLSVTWPSAVARVNRTPGRNSGTWAMVNPDEGVTGFVDNLCITTACRDPKLAMAFIDATIAPEAQVVLSDLNDFGPASEEAARRLSPSRRAQLGLDDPNHLNRLILWRPVANPAEYARIWGEARSGRLVQ